MSAATRGDGTEGFAAEAHEQEIVAFRASTRRWLIGSFSGWLYLVTVPFGFGVALVLVRWLRNLSVRYRLTDQRLIVSSGIILKRIDEIELYRIRDVLVEYSLLNQMVNIGTLSIRSSDPTTKGRIYKMPNVPDARQIREQLRSLVQAARRRRGVREFDVDHEGGW